MPLNYPDVMISTSSYLKILIEWLDNQISERLITCYNYDEFNILEKIGEGANAELHKAEWKDAAHIKHTRSQRKNENSRFWDSNYVITKKSDNYGLGVILWVISSCRMPFKNIPKQEIIFHILQGKREKTIENTPFEYINLYKRCWQDDPESRPNSNKILEDLERIISIE
ncbi:kinase-like protein [Gigaspora margarita]|uniref:Kinase-like protein n=1 Tax=Gigaspora margarita TaxID=4874 RepID=A0A8H4AMC7_GIGMA|nr:kinase-like protein [Gigaspora margarita]